MHGEHTNNYSAYKKKTDKNKNMSSIAPPPHAEKCNPFPAVVVVVTLKFHTVVSLTYRAQFPMEWDSLCVYAHTYPFTPSILSSCTQGFVVYIAMLARVHKIYTRLGNIKH